MRALLSATLVAMLLLGAAVPAAAALPTRRTPILPLLAKELRRLLGAADTCHSPPNAPPKKAVSKA